MTNLDAAREHVNVKLRSRDERVRIFRDLNPPEHQESEAEPSRLGFKIRTEIGTKLHHPDVGFLCGFGQG